MRYRFISLLLLIPLVGCGPKLARQDLGVVQFELPKLPGAKEPYPMPQLGPPLDESAMPGRPRLP
jgi:hypothetical protein